MAIGIGNDVYAGMPGFHARKALHTVNQLLVAAIIVRVRNVRSRSSISLLRIFDCMGRDANAQLNQAKTRKIFRYLWVYKGNILLFAI